MPWFLVAVLVGFLVFSPVEQAINSRAICRLGCDDNQWAMIVTIQQQARVYQVDEGKMLRVAWCESLLGHLPHGDGGHSHGPYQLSDLPTGLLDHFHEVGYHSPYDYNESSDYYARVLTGEWRFRGVTEARWSCR